MSDNLRLNLKRALVRCLDIFAEGSALHNNTRVALGRISSITDDTGTLFANKRMKRGVDTILSEACRCLEESDRAIFVYDELEYLRLRIDLADVEK